MRNLLFVAIVAACAAPHPAPPTLPSVDAFQDPIREPLTAHVGLCLAPNGEVTGVALLASSGEPRYDAAVIHDVRQWQLVAPGRALCARKAITYVP